MRHERSKHQAGSFLDAVAGVDGQVLAGRHLMLTLLADGLAAFIDGLDEDEALAAFLLTQANEAALLLHKTITAALPRIAFSIIYG